MCVDLQTYRAKIGTFRHSVGVDVVTIVCCVNFTGGLKTVGSVFFIGLLLIIAGIEQNPGPKDEEDDKVLQNQQVSILRPDAGSDAYDSIVGKFQSQQVSILGPDAGSDAYEANAGDSPNPTKIKVTCLPDIVDEDTIEMFFENTKKQGGGKVISVSLNKQTNTAIVEFEDPKAVVRVIQKQPITILGTVVSVSVYNPNPTKIKVKGLPDIVDEDTIEMFFENTKKQGGGKVISVSLNKKTNTAIVEFEEPKAVIRVIEKQPITILGTLVGVSVYNADETASPQPRKINVTGLPDIVDEDTIEMFFENTKKHGGGKVKAVCLDKQMKTAVVEFEEPEGLQY